MKYLNQFENRITRLNNRFDKLNKRFDKYTSGKNLLYTIYVNDDGTTKLLNHETNQYDFEFDNIEQLREELKNIDMLIHSKKYNL